jgi:thioredoxin 1
MSANTTEVNDNNFETEIENHKGVALVDFWATWCGPCRRIGPLIDELATEYKGKVKVAKIDVDDSPNTAMRFGIRSIPCLMLFKDGKNVDQLVGAPPSKESLKTWINGQVA